MEWISVKEKIPDPQKDNGYYVVLISRKPHIVYFSHRNWQRPWHIPDEWLEPTHYIKLDCIKDFFWNVKDGFTMD